MTEANSLQLDSCGWYDRSIWARGRRFPKAYTHQLVAELGLWLGFTLVLNMGVAGLDQPIAECVFQGVFGPIDCTATSAIRQESKTLANPGTNDFEDV